MSTKQTKKNISGRDAAPKHTKKKRVFVGMSGGVDSSVSAALLQKAEYDVTGVFMKVWEPDFLPCTWREERLDAIRVAAHLGIPLLTWDFEKEYKQGVADYMISEYRAGRTPNPDVMCNRVIKFGAFFDRAVAHGADFVATGHYARVVATNNGSSKMLKGVDGSKDQSYFLWTLGQRALTKTLFPIGGYQKSRVRALAKKLGLPTAQKKDSQGLCFVGQLDMKDFLAHFMAEKEGKVLDKAGNVIGKHRGSYFYTLGERRGFSITQKGTEDKAFYIAAKDLAANTITVVHGSATPEVRGLRKTIGLTNFNICNKEPEFGVKKYTAQVRYHGDFVPCTLAKSSAGAISVLFAKPILVGAGQSVVIYDGDECVGGGVAE